jgi:hypothetical protein
MDDVDDTVDVGVATMYSRAQATPPYRWTYAAFRSCAPSNEIGNTMDKVREADQVKRTAGNTNDMAHA